MNDRGHFTVCPLTPGAGFAWKLSCDFREVISLWQQKFDLIAPCHNGRNWFGNSCIQSVSYVRHFNVILTVWFIIHSQVSNLGYDILLLTLCIPVNSYITWKGMLISYGVQWETKLVSSFCPITKEQITKCSKSQVTATHTHRLHCHFSEVLYGIMDTTFILHVPTVISSHAPLDRRKKENK